MSYHCHQRIDNYIYNSNSTNDHNKNIWVMNCLGSCHKRALTHLYWYQSDDSFTIVKYRYSLSSQKMTFVLTHNHRRCLVLPSINIEDYHYIKSIHRVPWPLGNFTSTESRKFIFTNLFFFTFCLNKYLVGCFCVPPQDKSTVWSLRNL